jgi:hypothetical protein
MAIGSAIGAEIRSVILIWPADTGVDWRDIDLGKSVQNAFAQPGWISGPEINAVIGDGIILLVIGVRIVLWSRRAPVMREFRVWFRGVSRPDLVRCFAGDT